MLKFVSNNMENLTKQEGENDYATATLAKVYTYRKWVDVAQQDFEFSSQDIKRLSAQLFKLTTTESYFEQRLAGTARRSLRYRSKNGCHLIMTSLGEGLFLTRSLKVIKGVLTFGLAEEKQPGRITPLLTWKMRNGGSNHFENYSSHSLRYTLVTGPNDQMDEVEEIPTTRLIQRLDSHKFHVFHLQLALQQRVWPVSACFHPEDDELCAMVCSRTKVNHLPRDPSPGTLALYDTTNKRFCHSYDQELVSSTVLKFICGGQRLLVSDSEHNFPAYRKLLIFSTRGLVLLHQVHVLPTCTVNNPTVVYSGNYHALGLLLWRKKPRAPSSSEYELFDNPDENGNYYKCSAPSAEQVTANLQVAVYKIKVDVSEPGFLTKICCSQICSSLGGRNPDRLPLPPSLLQMVHLYSKRY